MAFIPFPWKKDDHDKCYEVEAAKFDRECDILTNIISHLKKLPRTTNLR